MNDLLSRLTEPFEPKHITWKPGATKENKCMALAFADLRAYMDRLDEVCGLDWSVRYSPWGDGRIVAELTIAGVTRSSTGEMDTQDEKNGMGGTVAEAQAFKRAATMFGLGRFLYDLPSVWVEFDPQRKRITEQGQRELDTRYATWYTKKMAARKPRPQGENLNVVIDPDTGEIIDGDVIWSPNATVPSAKEGLRPAGSEEPSNGKQPGTLSPALLTKLNALGSSMFKNRWDDERHALVKEVTNGAKTSATKLTPDEATLIITQLEAELKHARNGKVAA